jgi:predicted AlkP superfamily phosphohydrolase/phosphomutase
MQNSNRVLIVGIDGATWDVLGPWIQDGTLRHLARLRQDGSWGELRSTVPPLSAPAWSTFLTGKRPGKHGVFHFSNVFGLPDQDDTAIVNARSIQSPTLWDILGHHERRVISINVPMTYPPRSVNGCMITGLLTPRNARRFTHPLELAQRLGDYIIDLDRFIDFKPWRGGAERASGATSPSLSLMQDFREMLEKRATTSLSLMKSEPWDLFTVVFSGPDRMGHYLWPYHHGATTDDGARQLHAAVRDYYIRLDEIINELINTAGQDVNLLIISDHGMGPMYTMRAHWNSWLYEHGWLAVAETDVQRLNPEKWLRRLGLPRDKIGRILLKIPGIANSRPVRQAAATSAFVVDEVRSKAYAISMYAFTFGIRINAQDDEKQILRAEIAAELERVVDPRTGKRIVQHIYPGEEYYSGPNTHYIPEIIVVTDPDYTGGFGAGHYSAIATPRNADDVNSGEHRMEGVFLAHGPTITGGLRALPGMHLEDVAPTALYLSGLPVPSDMDGRVLTEVILPGVLETRPVAQGEPTGYWPDRSRPAFIDETISDEDKEQIEERLRALGYL